MRAIHCPLLILILLQALQGYASTANERKSCDAINGKQDNECGMYAYKIIKPMMAYFKQMHGENDKHILEMTSKNEEINQLEKKVEKLQLENIIYKTKEDSMAAVLQELKNQKIGIVQQVLYANKNSQIKELKEQVNLQKEEIKAKDKRVLQLEIEVKNLLDKSNATENKNGNTCLSYGFSSSVHNITIANDSTFEVLCNSDIAGPGWIIIQQRINGGVNFFRNWNTYQNGFGDFWNGDFFLGLEIIYRLTTSQPHELYIHMERFDGSTFYARYDEFAISGEDDQYRLSRLGTFSGPDDQFSQHKDMQFSTYDRDNDKHERNCANENQNGWWNTACYSSNLNGIYFQSESGDDRSFSWDDIPKSLKQAKMMIRPKAGSK